MHDEDLVQSDKKPSELVQHLLENNSNIIEVLDRVAHIMEQRNIKAIVAKVQHDGCTHRLDKYIQEVTPKDPEQFKLKIMEYISNTNCCTWRCYFRHCLIA